ncbi:MAG: hypothetical protein V4466_04980 [Pseudomonadota bacterium]
MNRLVLLLILATACAAPASAQAPGKIRVVIPAESPAKLRGTVGERASSEDGESAPAGDLSALVPAPVPVLPTPMRSNSDSAQQCRRSCHQEYYFCLAAEDETVCSPTWVKCSSRCG